MRKTVFPFGAVCALVGLALPGSAQAVALGQCERAVTAGTNAQWSVRYREAAGSYIYIVLDVMNSSIRSLKRDPVAARPDSNSLMDALGTHSGAAGLPRPNSSQLAASMALIIGEKISPAEPGLSLYAAEQFALMGLDITVLGPLVSALDVSWSARLSAFRAASDRPLRVLEADLESLVCLIHARALGLAALLGRRSLQELLSPEEFQAFSEALIGILSFDCTLNRVRRFSTLFGQNTPGQQFVAELAQQMCN